MLAMHRGCNAPQIVLGFDFGLKRIGVAIGQTITATASPVTTLKTQQNGAMPWPAIADLIKQWQPHALLVGLPRNMDGTDTSITHDVRRFIAELSTRFNLPIHEVDERLTSKEACSRLQDQGKYNFENKEAVDQIAAQIIIEAWLHEQGY